MTTTTHQQTRSRSYTLWSAAALAVATPITVWGLVGPQDAPGFTPDEYDYVVRPWNMPPALERGLTIAAIAVLVLAAAHLIVAVARGRVDLRWLTVLCPILAGGAATALLERMVTAGVIGADFNVLFAILVLVPFIVLMLALTVAFYSRLRNARS